MKSEIRHARQHEERTSQLATQAKYARERLERYRAQGLGPDMTSDSRLRELERESELAETRLRFAQTAPAQPAEGHADEEPESGDEDERRGEGGSSPPKL